jgi:hypothetical protein
MVKCALVCGAGGFIGVHFVKGTVRLLGSDFAGPSISGHRKW